MDLKYTPSQLEVREKLAEGDETPLLQDAFEGYLKIKCPSYPDRLRLPKELGVENLGIEDNPEAGKKEQMQNAFKNLEVMAACAEKIRSYVVEVDLKYKDGTELKSVDDLYDFPAAGAMVAGLCTKFLMGFVEKKV